MIRRSDIVGVGLLRHAEAYKNLAGVSGGGDQRLTPAGERQAQALGGYLLRLHGSSEGLYIVHQPEERSEQTARHIGAISVRPLVECPDLLGVGLGVAAGLTEKELFERFPDFAAAMAAWRAKGGLSGRPKVLGSEPMEEFAERIRRGLVSSIEACEPGGLLAIVGTTSTLNMMNHLLAHDGQFERGSYEFVSFPLGSLSVWRISGEAPKLELPITIPPQ